MESSIYTPTIKDWNYVKYIMSKYNRSSGWIDVIEENNGKRRLEFFDSNPYLNGCNAMYITKQEVEMYSKE